MLVLGLVSAGPEPSVCARNLSGKQHGRRVTLSLPPPPAGVTQPSLVCEVPFGLRVGLLPHMALLALIQDDVPHRQEGVRFEPLGGWLQGRH
jgi:hypothetical protein